MSKNLRSTKLNPEGNADLTPERKAVDKDSILRKELSLLEERLNAIADKHYKKLAADIKAREDKFFAALNLEISDIIQRTADLEVYVSSLSEDLKIKSNEIEVLKGEIETLKNNRSDVSSDAVLYGVPTVEGENLRSIFNQICLSVDFQAPQLRDIFRVNSPKSGLIVIKFYTIFDRNKTFKAFSNYRKRVKAPVTLRCAGFQLDGAIYLHESLPADRRKLPYAAIKLKRQKIIFNAFTLRGKVHVSIIKGADPISIETEENLLNLISDRND